MTHTLAAFALLCCVAVCALLLLLALRRDPRYPATYEPPEGDDCVEWV